MEKIQDDNNQLRQMFYAGNRAQKDAILEQFRLKVEQVLQEQHGADQEREEDIQKIREIISAFREVSYTGNQILSEYFVARLDLSIVEMIFRTNRGYGKLLKELYASMRSFVWENIGKDSSEGGLISGNTGLDGLEELAFDFYIDHIGSLKRYAERACELGWGNDWMAYCNDMDKAFHSTYVTTH